jgi:L-alanine-DL-glutamate epimerase-like enolase superfamily enzyme
MEATPERLRAEVAGYRDAGFTAVKIRAGTSPEADRAKAELCRAAIGPGIGLAVDAVQGSNPQPWSASQAIAAGQRLSDLDLLWFEEPCAATDVEGYRACRRALDIPIAGGESCTTLLEFEQFLEGGAVDIAQPDAAHVGGIIETLRVAALAAERGIEVAVHAWASGGCVMANYHAGFAAPNCHWLEYPTQPNPLITALLTQPLEVVDGYVLAPTGAGLGIDVTPELEERFAYKPGHHYFFHERRGEESQGAGPGASRA